MNRLIAIFYVLFIFSCAQEQSELYKELLGKPAIPILAQVGENAIIISDFVVNEATVDSISILHGNGMSVSLNSDNARATLRLDDDADRLGVLSFYSMGTRNDVLVKKSGKQIVTFTYKGDGDQVRIKGEMNAWNPADSYFEPTDQGWQWEVSLNPGKYQYLYVIDGVEKLDPSNQSSVDNGMGGRNSLIDLPRAELSELPILRTSSYEDGQIVFDLSNHADDLYVFCQNRLVAHWENIEAGKLVVNSPVWAENIKRTHLRIWAANGIGVSQDVLVPLEYGLPLGNTDQLSREDWHASMMYFMMIDRFRNGIQENDRPVPDPDILPKANHFGGDLVGIDQTIGDGYFDDLGVNTIWLSPITQNPDGAYGLYPDPYTKFSGYHGYWPISNSEVDDRFGTKQEMDQLIVNAHSRDMNVILDYVANHVHEEHPLYKAHPDWATSLYLPDGTENTQKWDEHRLTTWFDTFMPTLDLERPEVYEPMTDSALFWIKNADFDGFRHDATKHIPEVFWRTLTKKVKQEVGHSNRNIFQIGETYGSRELISSYITNGQLDAQFDFNVYDDVTNTLARQEISMDRLVTSLEESFAYYGHHNLMGYITGNQDRPRFISLASGAIRFDEDAKYAGWTRSIENENPLGFKILLQLHAFVMTIPGIPCIYYGDEYGSPGGNDPDNRRMMKFGNELSEEELNTLETTKKIISFRNEHLALIYGDFDFIHHDDNTLMYKRSYFDDEVFVAFNKNDSEESLTFKSDRELKAHFGNQLKPKGIEYSLEMAPHSFEIITLK